MTSRGLTRRLFAWATAAFLLLAQVAVATYACPVSVMPLGQGCIGGSDPEQPNLCKKHSQTQLQHVGKVVPPLAVPPATEPAPLPVPPLAAKETDARREAAYHLIRLARDGSPPLFLRLLVLLT